MRTIKLIGLTALTALAAMALIGVSSAMAEGSTALCKVDQAECAPGNLFGTVHEESVGKATLLSSTLNVECNVLFSGTAKLGNPATVTGKFTYSGCNNSCSVVEQGGPSVITVLRLGHELADVTGKGEVKLTCLFGFVKCVYNGTGLQGHGLGPLLSTQKNGEVRIEGQETHIVSGSCPASAFLDLLTTPLEATYISS
ncbi:MAG TPA: hypothetical protein VGH58_08200 [Solirubrobacterales bacterium]